MTENLSWFPRTVYRKQHRDPLVPQSQSQKEKQTVLCWLIDMGTLKQGDLVRHVYNNEDRNNKRRLDDDDDDDDDMVGVVRRDGILCGCSCYVVVTVAEFEAHWRGKVVDPLKNILAKGGRSLLQCMAKTWSSQDGSKHNHFNAVVFDDKDKSDHLCIMCGESGDHLVCCHNCPSSYHLTCSEIQVCAKIYKHLANFFLNFYYLFYN
jgi:hypothetical protein